ncbi:MAG TPA: hypothetical protein VF839_08670 [Clostridium sp.]
MERRLSLLFGIIGGLFLVLLKSMALGSIINGYVPDILFSILSFLGTIAIVYFSILLIIDTIKIVHKI